MNREMRRISEKEGRRVQKLEWNKFRELSHAEMALASPTYLAMGSRYEKVWQNHKYIVFWIRRDRFWCDREWDRIMVRRSDAQPICSWTDLQRIKNELFGDEIEAIQFLPRQSELTDVANLYWFFVRSE